MCVCEYRPLLFQQNEYNEGSFFPQINKFTCVIPEDSSVKTFEHVPKHNTIYTCMMYHVCVINGERGFQQPLLQQGVYIKFENLYL